MDVDNQEANATNQRGRRVLTSVQPDMANLYKGSGTPSGGSHSYVTNPGEVLGMTTLFPVIRKSATAKPKAEQLMRSRSMAIVYFPTDGLGYRFRLRTVAVVEQWNSILKQSGILHYPLTDTMRLHGYAKRQDPADIFLIFCTLRELIMYHFLRVSAFPIFQLNKKEFFPKRKRVFLKKLLFSRKASDSSGVRRPHGVEQGRDPRCHLHYGGICAPRKRLQLHLRLGTGLH